jgi:hypothetical protein
MHVTNYETSNAESNNIIVKTFMFHVKISIGDLVIHEEEGGI